MPPETTDAAHCYFLLSIVEGKVTLWKWWISEQAISFISRRTKYFFVVLEKISSQKPQWAMSLIAPPGQNSSDSHTTSGLSAFKTVGSQLSVSAGKIIIKKDKSMISLYESGLIWLSMPCHTWYTTHSAETTFNKSEMGCRSLCFL